MAATAILAAMAYKEPIRLGQIRDQGGINEKIPGLHCAERLPSGFGVCC
jgi:hypothetical protein